MILSIEQVKDNAAVRQIGVEFAIQQSKELIEFRMSCLHYYSMGKSDNIYQIEVNYFRLVSKLSSPEKVIQD